MTRETKNKSPADMLADIGRAIYGAHWRLALSRGVKVDDDTIRRWMTGRTELRADHGVFDDARALLQQRSDDIAAISIELEKWLKDNRGQP